MNNLDDISIKVETRFWSKVERPHPTECWEWQPGLDRSTYGQFNIGGRNIGVHRIAYMLERGSIPDGLEVCHRCDNPRCCNPLHLFTATHQGNIDDKVMKNRQSRSNAKLTNDEVREIRRLRAHGVMQKGLAKRFGVSDGRISEIVNYKTYKHI